MTKTQVNILAVTSFVIAAFFCLGTLLFYNEERTGAFILSAIFATGFIGLGFFILQRKKSEKIKDISPENAPPLKNNSQEQITNSQSVPDKQSFKAQEQSPKSVIPKPPAEPPTPPKFANKEEYEKWKAEKIRQAKEAPSSKISYDKIPLKSKGGVMTPKPLNEFGGWLRFFLVSWQLSLAIAILFIILVVGFKNPPIGEPVTRSIFFEPTLLERVKKNLIHIIDWLIRLIFSILVIRTVKIKAPNIPNTIIMILSLYVVIIFLLSFSLVVISFSLTGSKDLMPNMSGLVAFFIIWFLYFKKSKRVLYYYGKNAHWPFYTFKK